MKAYWESGCTVPHILDLGTRWRWVVSFTPWSLYPQGRNLRYPLDRRLGEPQSQCGHTVEGKNSQPSLGIEPQISYRPARSQSLYRLSYRGSWSSISLLFILTKVANSLLQVDCLLLYLRKVFQFHRFCSVESDGKMFMKHKNKKVGVAYFKAQY
jgi:hypothetical protein